MVMNKGKPIKNQVPDFEWVTNDDKWEIKSIIPSQEQINSQKLKLQQFNTQQNATQ
jgi:hypothetical protein